MSPLSAIPEWNLTNVSFSSAVREMRNIGKSYQDALREFKRQYVVGSLRANACHLGRTAEELGMHQNTITRTIRELRINVGEIRKELRGSFAAKTRPESRHRG